MKNEEWVGLTEEMLGPLLAAVSDALADQPNAYHRSQLPRLAMYHFAECLDVSINTNAEGRHAVALGLLRPCVESLTIGECGLIDPEAGASLLDAWEAGSKTTGQIRKSLERTVWTSYPSGLLGEPWSEYYPNLAKAIHPYAHFSPELLQWQLAVVSGSPERFVAVVGPGQYDATKASRITLLHALLTWTLAETLRVNRGSQRGSAVNDAAVARLRAALSSSRYLVGVPDWGVQLWPHMFHAV